MFRTLRTKLPTLILAIIACLVSVSGPVRVISLAQESESEISDSLKVKECYDRKYESRRLRQKQAHHPLWRQVEPLETDKVSIPNDRPLIPADILFSSSPPLRAPPA